MDMIKLISLICKASQERNNHLIVKELPEGFFLWSDILNG